MSSRALDKGDRVYISGPISAEIPKANREQRKERFNRAEQWVLQNTDWVPVNPLKVGACTTFASADRCEDSLTSPGMHTWACWMRYDLLEMLTCRGIILLPYATWSPSARLELQVATALGYDVHYANEIGEVIKSVRP